MLKEEFKVPRFRGLIIASVMLATTLYALDWTIVVVAFPQMKGIFSATEDQIAWVITCYVVASAIAMSTAKWASERFGRKTLMLFSVGGFTITSLLCGLSDSLAFEVVARTLQGFAGGFVIPLSAPIILDLYPRKEHGKALSFWSIGAFSGSFLGPVLGGYLVEYLSWRWVFYINIPIGLIAFSGILFFMDETKTNKKVHLDWFGFLTLAIGVGALQVMADRGHRLDWFESPEIIIEAVIACFALYLFFTHSLTSSRPFLDPRILLSRQFRMGMILIGFYGLLQTPVLVMMPVFLEDLIGYPVDLVGLLQTPRGVGVVVGVILAGRLSGRVDPRLLMGFGFSLLAISNFEMSHWSLDVTEWKIIWTGFFQGLGGGMIMLPTQEIAFYGSQTDQRMEASSIMNLVRSMCSSLGVSISLVIYFLNTGISRSELVPNVDWYSKLGKTQADQALNLAQIEREIERQATMLGYDGAFLFLAALSVLPLLLLVTVGKLKIGDQNPG